MKNVTLTTSDWPQGDIPVNMKRASKADTAKMVKACRDLHGTDMMPRVRYKGEIVEAGRLGTRSI